MFKFQVFNSIYGLKLKIINIYYFVFELALDYSDSKKCDNTIIIYFSNDLNTVIKLLFRNYKWPSWK